MKAEIITIGDEILIGQIVDTNSAWISRQLNQAGIEVARITSVGDRREDILNALSGAAGGAELVLITGGLGPTRDDITRNTVCEFFGTSLVFHQPTYDRIVERFKKRGIGVNNLDHDQALVPASCAVIPNPTGAAPGMCFKHNGRVFFFMPGVPFEMEAMMKEEILPRIAIPEKDKAIVHRTVLTQGVPESLLAKKIEPWAQALPGHIRLAYLPDPMAMKLRLSAYGDNRSSLEKEIEIQIEKLLPFISDCVFGYDDDTLAGVTGNLLQSIHARLSVAESCTGGTISQLITRTPGSSKWYCGGVTAYSNDVKTSLLGVSPDTLSRYGAVSSQTAREMARGVRKIMNTEYSIATTGIAGPDGGSAEKPVGTVWISVEGPAKFICKKYVFGGDRERNILRASQTALHMLRKLIAEENKK
jgi:nicotinamide-nucleotide amidase